MRTWRNLTDLATQMLVHCNEGKMIRLNPETARLVAYKLMTAEVKPTRNAVARLICDSKCQNLCIPCTFKANAITTAYGQGSNEGTGGGNHLTDRVD